MQNFDMGRPPKREVKKTVLLSAIRIIGGLTKTSKLIKVPPNAISNWLYTDIRVPKDKCMVLEKITDGKVAAKDLLDNQRGFIE